MGTVENDEFHEENNQEQTLPFLMDNLPDAFLQKAEKELNETAERRIKALREIREKIKTKKTLKDVEFHDDVLRRFLRHSKYDVNRTLKRLETAYYFRKNYLIFKKDPDEMFAKIRTEKMYSILPRRTKDGCIVFITRYGRWDPDQVPFYYFIRYSLLTIQQIMRDQVTQISGLVCIYDLKNLSFKTYQQSTPSNLYEAVKSFFHSIPVRYKGVHVVNHPAVTKIIWAILKPLLSEKIKKRFMFHSNPEELCDYIPITALPVEYGGLINEEELEEPEMASWMKRACDEQRNVSFGGHCNFY